MRVSRKDFAQDRRRFRAKVEKTVRGFVGQKVRNAATGMDITISRRGVGHTLYKAGDDLLVAATRIPDLLQTAKFIKSQPDKRNRPNVRAAHIYEADLVIDQEPHTANLVVFEDDKGNQFYDLGIIRKEGPGSAREREQAQSSSPVRHPTLRNQYR